MYPMRLSLLVLALSVFVASTSLAVPDDFIRGDFNNTGVVDVSDAVAVLSFLFVPGSPRPCCADAADANDDGIIGIGDAIYLFDYLFPRPGPQPPAPFPSCGGDPTPDGLPGCSDFGPCVPFCPQ